MQIYGNFETTWGHSDDLEPEQRRTHSKKDINIEFSHNCWFDKNEYRNYDHEYEKLYLISILNCLFNRVNDFSDFVERKYWRTLIGICVTSVIIFELFIWMNIRCIRKHGVLRYVLRRNQQTNSDTRRRKWEYNVTWNIHCFSIDSVFHNSINDDYNHVKNIILIWSSIRCQILVYFLEFLQFREWRRKIISWQNSSREIFFSVTFVVSMESMQRIPCSMRTNNPSPKSHHSNWFINQTKELNGDVL